MSSTSIPQHFLSRRCAPVGSLSSYRSADAVRRVTDCCCIVVSYLFALRLTLWLAAHGRFSFPSDWRREYGVFLWLALTAWVAIATQGGIYRSHRGERLDFAAYQMTRTIVLWALATTFGAFLLKLSNVSRQFSLYLFFGAGGLILARQALTMVVLRRLRRFGYDWRTALIVGTRSECERFAKILTDTFPNGYQIALAAVDEKIPAPGAPAVESFAEIDDAFIITGAAYDESHALEFLKDGKSVHIVPQLLDARLFRQELGDIGGIPVVSLLIGGLSSVQAIIKRTADIVASILLIVLTSPLFVAVAAANRLFSSGPVFFGQRRLGQNGRTFVLFKFRTMVINAEEVLKRDPELYQQYLDNNYKLPEGADPRITGIGRFLRAASLDELPQLFNVLRGEMSLVGPRPVVPSEVENYADYANLFLSAKPGLTGHWQVSGRSAIKEYDRRVELDLEYIRDQSLGKDLEILLRTVPAVLMRRGAF
jgi:exopolysaccharide biosynthesis polyprenyl glycosylphosphotransferase